MTCSRRIRHGASTRCQSRLLQATPIPGAKHPAAQPVAKVYVAETSRVLQLLYRPRQLAAAGPRQVIVANLPDGGHWTRDSGRPAVNPRSHAIGLPNCAGLAIQPGGGALWRVVNERDGLGNNLPPDYATAIKQGAFYGWPRFTSAPSRLRHLIPVLTWSGM